MLLYSARVIDAHEARAIGFVQDVVPRDELDAHIDKLTTQIARLAPLTHRSTKLSVEALRDPSLAGAAEEARRACYDSNDFREGVEAFLEKRHATFKGR